MSAQVTEGHRELLHQLLMNVEHGYLKEAAQAIADSEAAACEQLRAEIADQVARFHEEIARRQQVVQDNKALDLQERDQLRTEVGMLRGVDCGAIQETEEGPKPDGECGVCIKCLRARAERAEAELATERARLDWFANYGDTCWHDQTMGVLRGEDGAEFYADSFCAAIDAAMKEEARHAPPSTF